MPIQRNHTQTNLFSPVSPPRQSFTRPVRMIQPSATLLSPKSQRPNPRLAEARPTRAQSKKLNRLQLTGAWANPSCTASCKHTYRPIIGGRIRLAGGTQKIPPPI
ncbi:hypothetical protein CROQUDRAFT_25726, partial [Cronartium quercuum f. sp. fusiforme G11]